MEYEELMGEENLYRLFNKVTHSMYFADDLFLTVEDKSVIGRCIEIELNKHKASNPPVAISPMENTTRKKPDCVTGDDLSCAD